LRRWRKAKRLRKIISQNARNTNVVSTNKTHHRLECEFLETTTSRRYFYRNLRWPGVHAELVMKTLCNRTHTLNARNVLVVNGILSFTDTSGPRRRRLDHMIKNRGSWIIAQSTDSWILMMSRKLGVAGVLELPRQAQKKPKTLNEVESDTARVAYSESWLQQQSKTQTGEGVGGYAG
jgi:hypothetical protein